MSEVIIGIDPGKSGGIAVFDDEDIFTNKKIVAFKMPVTERDTWELISAYAQSWSHAFIEHVHSMPKQGVASTFKFGMNYGMLRAFLIAAEMPFSTVTPRVWQQSLKCLSGGDKNVTKRRAQELFPQVKKITHAIADALLIAEYGRQLRKGK